MKFPPLYSLHIMFSHQSNKRQDDILPLYVTESQQSWNVAFSPGDHSHRNKNAKKKYEWNKIRPIGGIESI